MRGQLLWRHHVFEFDNDVRIDAEDSRPSEATSTHLRFLRAPFLLVIEALQTMLQP